MHRMIDRASSGAALYNLFAHLQQQPQQLGAVPLHFRQLQNSANSADILLATPNFPAGDRPSQLSFFP
eukprot:3145615-Pleurochrysis_carterae.AAC.1